MKRENLKISLLAGFALITMSLPAAASAYTVTDTRAYAIDAETALYTITYTFRFADRPSLFPADAVLGETPFVADAVNYTFTNEADADAPVATQAAIVLSDASLSSQDLYQTPAAETSQFTLAAILKTPAGVAVTDYALSLDSLPFYTREGDEVSSHRLSGDELRGFRTGYPVLVAGSADLSTELTDVLSQVLGAMTSAVEPGTTSGK